MCFMSKRFKFIFSVKLYAVLVQEAPCFEYTSTHHSVTLPKTSLFFSFFFTNNPLNTNSSKGLG